jgi:heme-degrading monooxygenase HmoA
MSRKEQAMDRKEQALYASIRKYYLKPEKNADEFLQLVREGFVPLISQMSGFVAYYVVHVHDHDNEVISVSIFDSQEGAEESVQAAAVWVAEHLLPFLRRRAEITVGLVSIYQAAGKVP